MARGRWIADSPEHGGSLGIEAVGAFLDDSTIPVRVLCGDFKLPVIGAQATWPKERVTAIPPKLP